MIGREERANRIWGRSQDLSGVVAKRHPRNFYSFKGAPAFSMILRFDGAADRTLTEEQGGLNLYAFVGNDPANADDLLGLSTDDGSISVPGTTTTANRCNTFTEPSGCGFELIEDCGSDGISIFNYPGNCSSTGSGGSGSNGNGPHGGTGTGTGTTGTNTPPPTKPKKTEPKKKNPNSPWWKRKLCDSATLVLMLNDFARQTGSSLFGNLNLQVEPFGGSATGTLVGSGHGEFAFGLNIDMSDPLNSRVFARAQVATGFGGGIGALAGWQRGFGWNFNDMNQGVSSWKSIHLEGAGGLEASIGGSVDLNAKSRPGLSGLFDRGFQYSGPSFSFSFKGGYGWGIYGTVSSGFNVQYATNSPKELLDTWYRKNCE